MDIRPNLLDADTEATDGSPRWCRPVREGRQPDGPARGRRGRDYFERAGRTRIKPFAGDVSDEALLDRLRRGDAAAGEALVARHYTQLLRYLQRVAGPSPAEDLLQQTWLSVLGHADRFVANSDSGSFKAWLFRIAGNKTKDHWRSLRRETAAKQGLAKLGEGAASPWAGHVAEGAEQHLKLLEALGELPEPQREVLLLRYYSNMKFADVADVLGCPLNTALTRAHKAVIKLRGAMARESAAGAR